MVSAGTKMRLWMCEESHRSVRMVLQSHVKNSGPVSVVRLVKLPPYSGFIVDGDISHAGPVWSDEDMEGLNAVEIVRHHFHFVKKGYSLLNFMHFILDFKPRFLKPPSATSKKGPHSVLEKAYRGILSA